MGTTDKVFNIIIKLVKEGGADKETIRGLTDIKTAMTQGMAVAGVFVGAYYAIDKVLDATVGKLVTLAGEVERFRNQTGMTAEDSSRVLEVMRDLEISAEEVGTAFKFAEKNGFQPTITSLKAMQAEYLALNPGVERTQFLMKEFGKSGLSIQKFFETGDIAQRLEEVNRAMILSDGAILSVQDYKDATDELNDTMEGVKLVVGSALIKPVTAFLQLLMAGPPMMEHFAKALTLALGGNFDAFDKEMVLMGRHGEDFATTVMSMIEGTHKLGNIIGRDAREYQSFTQAEIDAARAGDDLNQILMDQTGWEAAYTGAKNAEERGSQAFDLLGEKIQGFSDEGALVWRGFLASTGKISPAAIAEFVKIQAAFEQVKKWLASGMSIPIITNFLTYTLTGSGPQTGTSQPSGGDWFKAGTVSGPGSATVWKNRVTGATTTTDMTGKARGGAFTEDMVRVGEQGEEWLVRAPGGGVVVLPNDMVRRMEAWGIAPGAGFAFGGVLGGPGGIKMPSLPGGSPPSRAPIQTPSLLQLLADQGAPGASPSSASAVSQVSAIAAVEAISPVVTGSVQTFRAASRENTEQSARQTEAVQRANTQQTVLLRSILNAIEGQAEQLAAEIQKRR